MAVVTTPWKEYSEGRDRYRIRAQYGIDYAFGAKHQQSPHFAITAETERKAGKRWREDSFGTQHEAIAAHFPELQPYLKWHLTSFEGPMHYIANAKYWWEMLQGKVTRREYDPDPAEAFKNTIVLGAVEGDRMPPFDTPWPDVRAWLEDRLPDLLYNYEADMMDLGVHED